jgi:hypothetical protein
MVIERSSRVLTAIALIALSATAYSENTFGTENMKEKVNVRQHGPAFSLSWPGHFEYGSRNFEVKDHLLTYMIADTLDEDGIFGIGIFEVPTRELGEKNVEEVFTALCADNNQTGESTLVDQDALFATTCEKNGVSTQRGGSLHRLPPESYRLIGKSANEWQTIAQQIGSKQLKLDASVSSITPEKAGFKVSIDFINGGDTFVSFSTPDNWGGTKLDGRLGTGSDGDGNEWRFPLTGIALTNAKEFPGNKVIIPPRSRKTLSMIVTPREKAKAGTYDFVGNVFMTLEYELEGKKNTMRADYRLIPKRITIDRDYPSTPAEWKEYEERKAKEVSSLRPGANVAEAGFYRAVSVFGPRAPFLTALQPGTSAPMLNPNEWDQWEWEADLARPVKCAPGEACPREGRWTPRVANYRDHAQGDLIYSAHERRFRVGDNFPAVDAGNDAARSLYWEWLGA